LEKLAFGNVQKPFGNAQKPFGNTQKPFGNTKKAIWKNFIFGKFANDSLQLAQLASLSDSLRLALTSSPDFAVFTESVTSMSSVESEPRYPG